MTGNRTAFAVLFCIAAAVQAEVPTATVYPGFINALSDWGVPSNPPGQAAAQ